MKVGQTKGRDTHGDDIICGGRLAVKRLRWFYESGKLLNSDIVTRQWVEWAEQVEDQILTLKE